MSEGTPRSVLTSNNNFTDYAQQALSDNNNNRLFLPSQTINNNIVQQSNSNYSIFSKQQNRMNSAGLISQGSKTSRKLKVASQQQQQQSQQLQQQLSSISLTKPSTPRSSMGLKTISYSQLSSPATVNNQHRESYLPPMFNFPIQQQQQQGFFHSLQEQQQQQQYQQFNRFPLSQSQTSQQNNNFYSSPTTMPSLQPYYPPDQNIGYVQSNSSVQERIQTQQYQGNCSSPSNSSCNSTSRSNKAIASATQSSNYFYSRGAHQPSMALLARSQTNPYIQQNQINISKQFQGNKNQQQQQQYPVQHGHNYSQLEQSDHQRIQQVLSQASFGESTYGQETNKVTESAAGFINPFQSSTQKQHNIQSFVSSQSQQQQQSPQTYFEGVGSYKQNYSPSKIIKLMEYLCSRGEIQQCADELVEYCSYQLKQIAIDKQDNSTGQQQSSQQNQNNNNNIQEQSANSALLSWISSFHSLLSTANTPQILGSSPFADITLPYVTNSMNPSYDGSLINNPFRDGLVGMKNLLISQLKQSQISQENQNPYSLGFQSQQQSKNIYDPAIEILETFMDQLLLKITNSTGTQQLVGSTVIHQKQSSVESIGSYDIYHERQLLYLEDQCRYLNGLGVASIRRGNLALGFQQFNLLAEITEGFFFRSDMNHNNTRSSSLLTCKVQSQMLNNSAVCALLLGEFTIAERLLSRSVSLSEGQLFPLIQSVSRKYLTKDAMFLEELPVMLFGYVYAQVLQRIKGVSKEKQKVNDQDDNDGVENVDENERNENILEGKLVEAPFLKNAIGLARKYFNPSHRLIEVLLRISSILDEPSDQGEINNQSRSITAHIRLILRVLQECGLELDSREVVKVVRFEQLQKGFLGQRLTAQRESAIEQMNMVQLKQDQHRKLKIHKNNNNNSSFKMKTASSTMSICHNASHSSGQDTTIRSYVGIGNASRVSTEPSLFKVSSQRIPKEDLLREGQVKDNGDDESTPYFDKKKVIKDNGNKVTGHKKNSTSQRNKPGQLKYRDHVVQGTSQRNDLNRSEDQISQSQGDDLIGNQLASPVQSEGDLRRKEEKGRLDNRMYQNQEQQQQQNYPQSIQRNSQKIQNSEIKQHNQMVQEAQGQNTEDLKTIKMKDKNQMQLLDTKSEDISKKKTQIEQQPSQETQQLQQQQIIQISTLEASINSMMSKLMSSSENIEQEKQSTIKEISSLRTLLSNLTETQRTTSQQLQRQQQQFINDQMEKLKRLENQVQQQEVTMQVQKQFANIPVRIKEQPTKQQQLSSSTSSAPMLAVLQLLESQPQKSLGLVKSISINNKIILLTSRLHRSGQLELSAIESIGSSSTQQQQQKQLAKQTLSKEQLKLILLKLNYHPILPATFSLNMCQSTYLLNKYFLLPFLAFDPGLNELKILSSACGLLSKIQNFKFLGETITWWLHYIEGNTFRIVLAKEQSRECLKIDLDMDMGSIKKWFECLNENEYAKEELAKLIECTEESVEQRNEQMKELQQRVWIQGTDKGNGQNEYKNKDGTYKVKAFRVLNENMLVTEITELIKVIEQTIQEQSQSEQKGQVGLFNGMIKQPYFVRVRIWSLGQKKVIQISQENMIQSEISVKVIQRNVHLTFGPGGVKIRAQGTAQVSCKQIQQIYGLEYPGLHRSEKIAILSHLPDLYALNVHEKNDESLIQKPNPANQEPSNAIVKQSIVSAAYVRIMTEVNFNKDGVSNMNFGSENKQIAQQVSSNSTGYLLPLTLEIIGAAGRLLGVRVMLYNHSSSKESGLFLTVDEHHWLFENKLIIKNSHHMYLDPPPLSQYFISHIFQHIICPILKKHISIVRDNLNNNEYALKLNRGLLAPNSTSIYRIENIINNQIIAEEGKLGIE